MAIAVEKQEEVRLEVLGEFVLIVQGKKEIKIATANIFGFADALKNFTDDLIK